MTHANNDWDFGANSDAAFSDIEAPEIASADIEDFADIIEIARRDRSENTATY